MGNESDRKIIQRVAALRPKAYSYLEVKRKKKNEQKSVP